MVLAESVNSINNSWPERDTPNSFVPAHLKNHGREFTEGESLRRNEGAGSGRIWEASGCRHLGGIWEASWRLRWPRGAQGHIVARSGVTTLRNAKSSLICLRVTSVITAYLQQLMLSGSAPGTRNTSRPLDREMCVWGMRSLRISMTPARDPKHHFVSLHTTGRCGDCWYFLVSCCTSKHYKNVTFLSGPPFQVQSKESSVEDPPDHIYFAGTK